MPSRDGIETQSQYQITPKSHFLIKIDGWELLRLRLTIFLALSCVLAWLIRHDRAFARFPLVVQLLKEWNAPVASGSRSEALGELTRDTGAFAIEVCVQFSKADSKAEANMIVGIHHSSLGATSVGFSADSVGCSSISTAISASGVAVAVARLRR